MQKIKVRQFKSHTKNRRMDMIEFIMIRARFAFSALTPSVGHQEKYPVCKN